MLFTSRFVYQQISILLVTKYRNKITRLLTCYSAHCVYLAGAQTVQYITRKHWFRSELDFEPPGVVFIEHLKFFLKIINLSHNFVP